MRIAQIAPLYESCPPKLYGGTERVVSWLTEELVRLGHDVTLFASGDSRTKARLSAGAPRALRLDWSVKDPLSHHMVMLDQVVQQEDAFDILHFHTDYLHFPLTRLLTCPSVTTLHGRQDLPDLGAVYRRFNQVPLVSISDAQRTPIPFANWRRTIHHGLPEDLLAPGQGDGGYLAFIGRISPEKRLDRAIEIARAAGMPLKVAAKVDNADKAYFDEVIAPSSRRSRHRIHRRDRRRSQRRISGQCGSLAVPDRLAGAFRAGDDRGHGVRHPGPGVRLRFGARGDRPGRLRRRRRFDRGGRRDPSRSARFGQNRGPAAIRGALHRRDDGLVLCFAL